MYTLLVLIIYLAFISLGLPDSLLGSCWPVLHLEIHAPLSQVGIVSMIISCCTIISALFSDRLTNRIGTSKVTAASVLLTSISMFLFSQASSFWMLCAIAIPYGLGAGAIDASLNNYVALHLKASHMSWLHCMWGIGATISPIVMSYALTSLNSWRMGYRIIGAVQLVIAAIMFLSIPIWKEDPATQSEADPQVSISPIKVIRIKGVKSMLIAFLCYCAIEGVNFVWASSYFNNGFGISGERAAKLASLYYCGMMIGRVISGFVADRMGDKKMIRIGSIIILIASALMYLFNNYYTSIAGFLLSGLGSGPIYPSLIHETPENFERKYSQSIIGVQMASAYTGSLFSPYLFGLLAEHLDIKLLPLIVLVLDVFVFLFAELYHRNTGKK